MTRFLNACGRDEAAPKMKAFLDFIMGKESEDLFIQELRQELYIAKHNAQWRGEYMKAFMERNEIAAKNRKDEKHDTAIRLSKMGLSVSEIMQGTQLTLAEVLQIIPSLKN